MTTDYHAKLFAHELRCHFDVVGTDFDVVTSLPEVKF